MDKNKLLEGLKKIKEAFSSLQNFKEAKLADGETIIKYEGDLSIGTKIFVVTEDGQVAAPDAGHKLEDGTIVTTVEGVVTEIKEIEKVDAKKDYEDKEKDMKMEEFISEITKNLNLLNENLLFQKKESEKKITELTVNIDVQKQTLKEMFTLLNKVANEPSAKPAESVNKKFNISEYKIEYKKDIQNINKKIN